MQRGMGMLSLVVWLGAAEALAQGEGARSWGGVQGAEPLPTRSPKGCFLYRDHVVLEKPTAELGNDVVVKDRRKFDAQATPAQLCADDNRNVVLRSKAEDNDSFAGLSQGVLFIDRGTGARQRTLLVQPLTGGKKPVEVAYDGETPVRVQGTSLYFFAHPLVKSKTCQPAFFQSGTTEEKCRKQAEAMWRCVQQDAAPRLDATPPPFSHPSVFPTEKGTDCQLDLVEQQRLDLSTLESTPTGHVWGRAFFMAAD